MVELLSFTILIFVLVTATLKQFVNAQELRHTIAPEATPWNKQVCTYEEYEKAVELFNTGNNYHVVNDVKNAELKLPLTIIKKSIVKKRR